MTATLRVAAWLLLVLVAVVVAQDLSSSPAGEEAAAAAPAAGETRAASDDSGPQTRFFLPGVSNLVNNIFNPCSRCNAGDQQFANRCCQSGERQCCFALQPFGGGGFGQGGFGQGGFGHGGFGQGGFEQGGFGPGGFGHGGFGQGGFGHGHGGGFNQGGFGGGFQQGGFGGGFNNFQQNVKPGFCSKPGLFGGLFSRSNADAASDSPVGLRSLPGGSTSTETGTEASPTGQAAQDGRAGRRARQAPEDSAAPASDASQPSTRFLPNPFGPGPLIPNPFCRDECFNDFDCPGNLKCCLRDCRKCFNPSFF